MSTLKNEVKQIQNIEELLTRKYMMIDAKTYHAAMLAELWNLYSDEAKHHLCRNILIYCHTENAFNGDKVNENPVMVVSIKDSTDNVEPYAYYSEGKIKLIRST